jgi:hypothetical protein
LLSTLALDFASTFARPAFARPAVAFCGQRPAAGKDLRWTVSGPDPDHRDRFLPLRQNQSRKLLRSATEVHQGGVVGTDDALLVPVGHDLGALYSEAGSDQRRQQVRIGVDVIELEDSEFAVWLLAHGIDDQDRPTRASLTAAAQRLGLETAGIGQTVDRITADGLIFEVEPGGESAVRFAEEHQLFPLMHGLGPDAEQPWLQTIGLLNQPVVQVSNALYDVWFWAQLAPQLWTGCHDAAMVAKQAGVTNPEEVEPRQVLAGVLANVHALLCVRAAYFDRRRIR